MHRMSSRSVLSALLTLPLLLLPGIASSAQQIDDPAGRALATLSTTVPPPGAPLRENAASVASPTPETLPSPSEAIADVLNARGRYLLAIRTYEALPPTAAIMNKLGIACEHMLMFDRARASFDAAIKLNPKYAEAYNNLGTLAHSQGDLPRAEKMYKKSLKLKPEAPGTLKNLGTLYYAEKKYKKGDQAYQQAVKLDPEALERSEGHSVQAPTKQTVSEVHYHMAMTYAQAGSQGMALEYLRKAIGEGFHDRSRLLHDKEFADIRTQPLFLQMVDDLRN